MPQLVKGVWPLVHVWEDRSLNCVQSSQLLKFFSGWNKPKVGALVGKLLPVTAAALRECVCLRSWATYMWYACMILPFELICVAGILLWVINVICTLIFYKIP